MKLVNQSAELIKQEVGYEGMLRHIERCGRVCYKSEDRITYGSAEKFVDMIVKNGHWSVLEHGTIIAPNDHETNTNSPYVREEDDYCVTNLRYYLEAISNSLTDAETEFSIVNQTPEHRRNRRVTFHVVTSRDIIDEIIRHRHVYKTDEDEVIWANNKNTDDKVSPSVESTRFCNYTKNKFGNELTCLYPSYWDNLTEEQQDVIKARWRHDEEDYFAATAVGLKPEQARKGLPLDIKSEAYLTAFVDDWLEVFRKRITPAAHPDAVQLCIMMRDEMIKNKYITFEDVTKLEV